MREWLSRSDSVDSRLSASTKLPSLFSNLMGLTLCGIVDDPTSPSFFRCTK